MDIARHTRALLVSAIAAFVVLVGGVVFAACGDDDDDGGSGAAMTQTTSSAAAGNDIDLAFVRDMIPHHESAVEMARIARSRGQSAFVENLAADIIRSQQAEIEQLQTIGADLDKAGVRKAGDLGVPEHQMGMDGSMASLRSADPFDREFIDMMIPHHQGAIRMARAELAQGNSQEAKTLAQAIIRAQTREIEEMNEHRKAEFGSESPAGGVPTEDSGGSAMSDDSGSKMEDDSSSEHGAGHGN